MSVDLTIGPLGSGQTPTDDEVIAMAREAIDVSRDEMRRGRDGVVSNDLQQPGVTVDLGHRNITRLPDEVIDIIKVEIERLAISHNRVASFPEYISECKRLRYLNARYNALRDFPKAILQLSSLEILDLSRNRIKRLPEDIRNLSSLKVLAVQKNRIERLPLSIGDMTSLRMLKFDDNPLVFPPQDVLILDALTLATASGNEVEALLTTQVKKYLKQASTAATNRQRLQIESDGEVSEDALETPRPLRPAGTRFPVRPSISGLDSLGIPSAISPEAQPTASAPTRSHRRLRSNQPAMLKRSNLLSPPEGSDRIATNGDETSGITVRPKRHGMVTPRVSEAPKIEEALSKVKATTIGIDEIPDSETIPSLESFTSQDDPIYQLKTGCEFMHNTVWKFASEVNDVIRSFDWGEDNYKLRFEITKHVDDAMKVADELSNIILDIHSMRLNEAVAKLNVPICTTYDVTEALAQYLVDNKGFLADRDLSNGVGCANIYMGLWQTSVQLTAFGDLVGQLIAEPSGRRLVPMFEKYRRETMAEGQSGATSPDAVNGISPNPSFIIATSSRSRLSTNPTASDIQVPRSTNLQALDQFLSTSETDYLGNDGFPSPTEEDMRFEQIVMVHRLVVERCSEILPTAYERMKRERDVSANYYGEDHSITRSLGLMLARFEGVMQAVQTLDQRLSTISITDKMQRTSKALWKDFRRPGAEWSHTLDLVANLSLPSITTEIKSLCKPIHNILKEATRSVAESPWATAAYDNTRGPQNGENPNFYAPGSVPSTPLSAAIGPAASAAVNPGPSARERDGPLRTGSSTRINFFERVDEYQRNTQNRRI